MAKYFVFLFIVNFSLIGCSAYQTRTILEPIGNDTWNSKNYFAKYRCNDFEVLAYPSLVEHGMLFMGPLGLPIIPASSGAKDRIYDNQLPEKLKYPDNMHVIIEIIESSYWDFTKPPNVLVSYKNNNYLPIQQVNLDYHAEYIYAFDLLPEDVNEFTLSFSEPFEGCQISNLTYVKNKVHNYGFNILGP